MLLSSISDKENRSLTFTLLSTTSLSLIIFFVVYGFVRGKYKKVFSGMFLKNINFNFLYTIIPMVIGTMLLNVFFNTIIPSDGDDTYKKFMVMMASNKLHIVFFMIPIVIIAPITEELIFRGIILRGIASHHSAKIAIFLSAFLFSIFHLNLTQIPNAFILGVIFAFIMIHTKNIAYTIIYHAINNFLVTFTLFFVKPEDFNTTNDVPKDISSPLAMIMLVIVGIVLIYLGLKWTIKTITQENRSIIPDKYVHNSYLANFENSIIDEEN